MKAAYLLAVATLVAFPLPARADGNEFLSKCAPVVARLDHSLPDPATGDMVEASYSMGYCLGFAQGFTGAHYAYGVIAGDKVHLVCLPSKSIQNGQALRIIVAFMKAHPEKLHFEEMVLAEKAFEEAFPCAKQGTGEKK